MASQWMIDRIKGNTTQSVTPVTSPLQKFQSIQKPASVVQPQKPIAQPKDNWASPQGKLFSGNIVQKAFDLPMLPQYAMSGFQKAGYEEKQRQIQSGEVNTKSYGQNILNRLVSGAKGILPGIQNRTVPGTEQGNVNVGKELGIKSTLGQSGYNLALSLATPSLAVGKVAKVLGKIPIGTKILGKAGQVVNKGTELLRSSEPVAKAIEHIPGMEYFRNPVVGKIFKEANESTRQRVGGLFNQINDVAKGLKPYELEEVGAIIEGKMTQVTPANRKLFQRANYIKTLSDKVGKELVDLGLMKPESFAKYKGGYLAHIADMVKKQESFGGGKPLKFITSQLKERKNKLGSEGYPDYIKQFQFPTFKALGGEITTAESTKALKEIVGKVGSTGQKFMKTIGGPRVTKEGMTAVADLVPKNIAHLFKDMAVPKETAEYISKRYATTTPQLLDKIASKALGYWKMGKTVVNPAYHVRNFLSNLILSDMSTGRGLVSTLGDYKHAVDAYRGKGSPEMMKYLQEMKDLGVVGHTSLTKGIQEFDPKTFTKGKSVLSKLSPFKLQNASEETSKLNVFSYWRRKGLDVKQAAAKAEEAIFSPYKIGAAERGLTRNVIPFYSFTRQALPFTAKTLANNPERITKYQKFKTGVESLSPEGTSQNELLPENAKGTIRLPVKNKEGNYVRLDPTYVYPFGNFTEGSLGRGQLPFGLGLNPLAMEAAQQVANKDFYYQQPISKSKIPEVSKKQRIEHGIRTIAPTLYSTAGYPATNITKPRDTRSAGGLYAAFKGIPDYAGRERSKAMATLNAFGIKTSIIRPEEQIKFQNMDRRTLLKEIENEKRTYRKDNRIPEEDKKILIDELNKVKSDVLAQ